MQLTKEQRTFIAEKYFQAKSFQQVIQSYQEHFPERQSPTKMTIWRKVTRYRTEGTSLNLNKVRSGRKRTGRSEENVRIVQGALTENPQISARKSGLDITKSTFNRIITLDLKWHPYKMHVRNKLLDNDLPRRLNFAQWFFAKKCSDQEFLLYPTLFPILSILPFFPFLPSPHPSLLLSPPSFSLSLPLLLPPPPSSSFPSPMIRLVNTGSALTFLN
ncbi:Protein of unknown function DUF4817 [Trinorchestia longiramus]|nr:Protein of unknown function DUF4817 [Trinorchestia longiramus]